MPSNDDKQPNLIALITVMTAASIAVVVARFVACLKDKTHKFGLDDFFAFASLPWMLAYSSLVIWWIHMGLGKHAATLPVEHVGKSKLVLYIGRFFYDAAISFPKFSALFFYRRIFGITNWKPFHYAWWMILFANTGYLVSSWLTVAFQCHPIAAAYNPRVKGQCIPLWPGIFGFALTSMIIDLLILILPVPMIWKIKVNWKRKLQVIFMFFCGYSVVITSTGRMISVHNAARWLEEDVTYNSVTFMMWVQCEAPISIIGVCLPTLFGFLKQRKPRRSSSVAPTGSSSGKSGSHVATHSISASSSTTQATFCEGMTALPKLNIDNASY